MSKYDKALARLKSRPKNFTWDELMVVLTRFGYKEFNGGGGSGRKLINAEKRLVIMTHKPHPDNILKPKQLDDIVDQLILAGFIKEE